MMVQREMIIVGIEDRGIIRNALLNDTQVKT
jgi:hypothetical protein